MHEIELAGGKDIKVERLGRTWRIHSNAKMIGAGYNGGFKVIPAFNDAGAIMGVDIINGSNPNDSICGITDIGDVEKSSLELKVGRIYLIATYDSRIYKLEFSYEFPTFGNYGYWIIAQTTATGAITQLFKSDVIYFNSRYIL